MGVVKIIGICGGSGSGKTYLSRRIAVRLGAGHFCHLSMDHYYRDQSHLTLAQRANVNFDHPATLEIDLLARHLAALKGGGVIERPTYDFSTHTRTNAIERISPTGVVLVDGILVFHDENVRRSLDLSVFVDAPADVRLSRRIRRDMKERGRDLEGILRQSLDTVAPMHNAFVDPQRHVVDLVVDGSRSLETVIEVLLRFVR